MCLPRAALKLAACSLRGTSFIYTVVDKQIWYVAYILESLYRHVNFVTAQGLSISCCSDYDIPAPMPFLGRKFHPIWQEIILDYLNYSWHVNGCLLQATTEYSRVSFEYQ